jgi:integrase/recombinase XerD
MWDLRSGMVMRHSASRIGVPYHSRGARQVKTKFSKSITTYFLPVGDGVRETVTEWVRYLREDKLWGHDDPLFPITCIARGQTHQFEVAGLESAHWNATTPIRKIFREAFERAGLPYFNPHSLRKTLTRLGLEVCHSTEALNGWSQNLGHEQILTTLQSYGTLATERQGDIIKGLGAAKQSSSREWKRSRKPWPEDLRGVGINQMITSAYPVIQPEC